MKLRIRGNSIRLRLAQGEVSDLGKGLAVEERVDFNGNSSFSYRLVPDATSERISADFRDGVITVMVPRTTAERWADTDEVGLIQEQPIEGGLLKILIEKDFRCLEVREGGEDEDTFPNPRKC